MIIYKSYISQLVMGNSWSGNQQLPLDGLGFPGVTGSDVDIKASKRKLDHLLRANVTTFVPCDINYAITSAFYLGASAEKLTELYEKWADEICVIRPDDDPIAASVGKFNLDEFIGEKKYEQRYYDYFRDCLSEYSRWSTIFSEHMNLFWNRLSLGAFRPLRELATALETGNDLVACRALAEACSEPAESKEQLLLPNPVKKDLSTEMRKIARLAMKSNNEQAVINVQAASEVFLSPTKWLKPEEIFAILEKLEQTINQGSEFRIVSPQEALESGDYNLVMFTRSRLVLEKVMV